MNGLKLVLFGWLIGAVSVANATVVYENDFQGGDLTDWSVIGFNPGITTDDNGENVFGLFNENQTITFSRSNTAGSYQISFDFFAINSWDSLNSGCCFPDGFEVVLNGVTVFDEADPFSLPVTGQDILAFVNPGPDDLGGEVSNDRYRPTFDVNHVGGPLTLSIIGKVDQPGQENGNTGFFDEPWAIDNISFVRTASVTSSEPGTLALLFLGLISVRLMTRGYCCKATT